MAISQTKIIILTALPVEYSAVREHLTKPIEVVGPLGTVYEIGFFATDRLNFNVCIVEIGPGNQSAAVEAERAIQYFSPNIAFFAGVAGGIKDTEIGDVVAATKVYSYESGKVVDEGLLPRPIVYNCAYELIQRARAEARKAKWILRVQNSHPSFSPKAIVAPIAAGEKVIASTSSSTYVFLRKQYSDAVAVEMEGIGFLNALQAHPHIPALIVRGISDILVRKSTSDAVGSQDMAARHAAAFLFQVLAELPQKEISPAIHYENDTAFCEGVTFSAEVTTQKSRLPSTTTSYGLLSMQQLDRVEEMAIKCGLVSIDRRSLLLASIPQEFVLSLPQRSNPLDQFRSDLLEINATLNLVGLVEPPLVVWLRNAARLARPRPEMVFFEKFIRDLNDRIRGGLGETNVKD